MSKGSAGGSIFAPQNVVQVGSSLHVQVCLVCWWTELAESRLLFFHSARMGEPRAGLVQQGTRVLGQGAQPHPYEHSWAPLGPNFTLVLLGQELRSPRAVSALASQAYTPCIALQAEIHNASDVDFTQATINLNQPAAQDQGKPVSDRWMHCETGAAKEGWRYGTGDVLWDGWPWTWTAW